MSSLGEKFPEFIRQSFSERNIVPGAVFRLFATNTNPPKIKFCVILGTHQGSACVGYLFINSEINSNMFPTEALRSLHLPLSAEDLKFLNHDSFLDCSNIHEIEIVKLVDTIKDDPARHLGALDNICLDQARNIIKGALTISPALKQKFLL